MTGMMTVEDVNRAANSKSANIFAGAIFEFITALSLVNIYAVASASNMNITVMGDSDITVDDQEIVAIGTTLNKSDHLLTSFVALPGTRLSAFLRETGGAATTDTIVGAEIVPL